MLEVMLYIDVLYERLSLELSSLSRHFPEGRNTLQHSSFPFLPLHRA
jgi:hypothetical protein